MEKPPVPRFFLILSVATAVLFAAVVVPLVTELVLAGVLAGVLWPLQKWLQARLGGRDRIAAGLITAAVVVTLIGPLAGLVAMIIRDGSDGLAFVADTAQSQTVTDLVDRLPDTAREVVRDAIADMPRDLNEALGQVGEHREEAVVAVSRAVALTGSVLFHGALMLIALFFMLAHGDELISWLDQTSPLRRGQTAELLTAFKKVSYSVVVATVITSGVQAVAALVGYLVARVPNPVFFTSLTFLTAFIPAIGAASTGVLAAALLLVTGHAVAAIFLAAWSVVVVGLADNVVRPYLIKRGLEVHGAVVFFALLGGLGMFGAIGLVIGPIALSMALTLLRMYHRDYSPHRDDEVEAEVAAPAVEAEA